MGARLNKHQTQGFHHTIHKAFTLHASNVFPLSTSANLKDICRSVIADNSTTRLHWWKGKGNTKLILSMPNTFHCASILHKCKSNYWTRLIPSIWAITNLHQNFSYLRIDACQSCILPSSGKLLKMECLQHTSVSHSFLQYSHPMKGNLLSNRIARLKEDC